MCVVCSYPGADTHTNAHTPSQAHSYPPTHTCARLYTVGDNGVHASASPFEGLAERLNWCGADLATDSFGQALLQSGVPANMIANWTVDPQVCACMRACVRACVCACVRHPGEDDHKLDGQPAHTRKHTYPHAHTHTHQRTHQTQVAYLDGSKGSLFDSLEDMDAPECLAKCKALSQANGRHAHTRTAHSMYAPERLAKCKALSQASRAVNNRANSRTRT